MASRPCTRCATAAAIRRRSQYFTSGMTRTEQTFAALYGDRPHGTLPGMQEMRFGEFEGKTYADLKDDPAFPRVVQRRL